MSKRITKINELVLFYTVLLNFYSSVSSPDEALDLRNNVEILVRAIARMCDD